MLTIHVLCTHQETWCFWRNHTNDHITISITHSHQTPWSLNTAQSLLFHLFGQISLLLTIMNILNHPCSLPGLPFSSSFFIFGRWCGLNIRQKIEASSSCYQNYKSIYFYTYSLLFPLVGRVHAPISGQYSTYAFNYACFQLLKSYILPSFLLFHIYSTTPSQ